MNALLLVDIQNDFCINGNLAVKDGEMVVPVANQMMEHFELVVASQDWHPRNHLSFASQHSGKKVGDVIDLEGTQQVLWQDHCVQNSFGAELRGDLNQKKIAKTFQKGYHKNVDSYSSFYDMNRKFSTGLSEWLKEESVCSLFVLGLATDYCVKFSVLDALQDAFQVCVISDGCRAVNLDSIDEEKALAEMQKAGADITNSSYVAQNFFKI